MSFSRCLHCHDNHNCCHSIHRKQRTLLKRGNGGSRDEEILTSLTQYDSAYSNRVVAHLSCMCNNEGLPHYDRNIADESNSIRSLYSVQTSSVTVYYRKVEITYGKLAKVVTGNYYDVIQHLLKLIGTMTGVWCFGLTNCVTTARKQTCPIECNCTKNLTVSTNNL